MKNVLRIFAMFLPLLILGCEKDQAPLKDNYQGWTYPMNVGAHWEYQGEAGFFNLRGNTGLPADSIEHFSSSVEIIERDTLPNGQPTTVFFSRYVQTDSTIIQSYTHYFQTPEGLFMAAYAGPSPRPNIPRITQRPYLKFLNRRFEDMNELRQFALRWLQSFGHAAVNDSLILEEKPVPSLAYPLYVGKEWIFRQANHPFLIRKKVVKKETVSTPAGKFLCYIIQFYYDLDNDGVLDEDISVTDHMATIGLVQRQAIFHNIGIFDENGNPVGLMDSYFLWQLQSYDLAN